jgi:hypothetical protein
VQVVHIVLLVDISVLLQQHFLLQVNIHLLVVVSKTKEPELLLL